MQSHYHLSFQYVLPRNVDVKLIDYNLCDQELCFFFDFQPCESSDRTLCERQFTLWMSDELVRGINAVSTFALDNGKPHADERVTGIRYLENQAEFESICQKIANDPNVTQNLRYETCFSEIWTGEQKYL